MNAALQKSKDSQLMEFRKNSPNDQPRVWTTIEQMTFGSLNVLLQNINNNIAKKISDNYNLNSKNGISPTDFKEFVKVLLEVRNICAHHEMLWNYNLSFKPKHNAAIFLNINHLNNHKIIHAVEIIDYLLASISPDNKWRCRINELIDYQFPDFQEISCDKMGL